jgi:DNA-binding transcriptional MerR regulator
VTRSRTYQVKDVAQLAGVSVRTLHHYDSIGLLVPKARSASGYRLYTDADLLRLQQILIGRELGLSLEHIRRSLEDPRFDQRAALLDQRRRNQGETNMENLFEGFNPSEYEEEVWQRWGTSEAFVESEQRTKRYTPDDWKAFKAEQEAIYDDAFSALKAGKTPADADVMDIAERHRMSIDRWFYPCSHRMHQGLASMYEADDRFRRSIDNHGEGLTTFLVEAIRANAERHQD